MYTVYCHTNKINNKKYIGITRQNVQQRWRDGKGYQGQNKFYNAIEKYGWDKFNHDILYENLTEQEACEIEQFLIKYYDTIKNGYNTLPGGNVTNHSPSTINKLKKNTKHSPEVIKKMTSTKIDKYGIRVKCIETNQLFESMGEANRITGIDKSSISRCCKGQQLTAGGYHWCFVEVEEIKNIQDKRKKKVRCITTGKTYNSIQEAANDTGSDASNICKVCNGKYKTTNKLKWEWFND